MQESINIIHKSPYRQTFIQYNKTVRPAIPVN